MSEQQNDVTEAAPMAEQQAETGIQFVDFADGIDTQAILGRPAAIAEAGGAGVSGAGDDLGQAVALAFGSAGGVLLVAHNGSP